MKNEFASLVGKTMEGLENNSKTVEDLIVLLEGCDTLDRGSNSMIKELEELEKLEELDRKGKIIKKAFRVLNK